MVRTQSRNTSLHFEPSRIFAYSAAIALHALALGMLLIPLAQAPIRKDTAPQDRWQVPEVKPVVPTPPRPDPIPITHAPSPPRQPALPAPVDNAPMPIFATEAIVTAPVDVAPVEITAPAIDSMAPSSPLEGVTLRYQRAPAPAYPRDALIAGAQGTVTLRVLVGEDGSPLEVTIERSSGNRSLDAAARNQVFRRWKFHPAVDAGRPVQAYGLIPVDFKLG